MCDRLGTNNYLITFTFLILGITGTYLISFISYKLIEKPFLKLKRKFT
jgi:peptidoglycan/LPS O-acetylase OafA/YrhL